VLWIGLAIPNQWSLQTYLSAAVPNYLIKLGLAVAMTPVIYGVHWLVERYLGHALADDLAESAARASE
jgi:queuosine precursor transporter